MNTLLQLWKDKYGVDQTLETDCWPRRLFQTHLVARLMNAFPRTATRVFSCSRGELANLLFREREGGSFRVLRTMYRFEHPEHRGDLLNRIFMQAPAARGARNRRRIAQWMLATSLQAMPPGPPRLVLALGGGDGSQEAEVIAQLPSRDVYYCGVDRDERAVAENQTVLAKHKLEGRGVTYVGSITQRADVEKILEFASRQLGVEFDGVSVAVCLGLLEYLDIGASSNDTLYAMLRAFLECTRTDGALITSQTDYHDRVRFLEEGLGWHMRLRSCDELAEEVERAGWQLSICDREPMGMISMCLATKSGVSTWRLDKASALREPHVARRGSRNGKLRVTASAG